MSTATLESIVALCKRRGFVFQSAEIYGGLNGVYDFGPLGLLLKNNIQNAWMQSLENTEYSITFIDGALLGPEMMWKASGHIDHFHDPMVDCQNCKHRFRADHVDLNKPCPDCGIRKWTPVRQFHLMFKTDIGAVAEQGHTAYLRPETAQSIFVNFKNVMTTNRLKIPFGIAQIGKAFRNEITPRQFLFRVREFEQMEIEWFCKPDQAMEFFQAWVNHRIAFYHTIGMNPERIRTRPHTPDERAHYSTCCTDVEYEFPFGWKELEGIAHRGDYDLSQHSKHSGKDLAVFDDATKTSYLPNVIECSVGTGRLFLALLFNAYKEEQTPEGDTRTVLNFVPSIAPIKAAFLPLTKQQNDAMERIYHDIKKNLRISVDFDVSGSIGKRYRRQDEIGTPLCFTYDFESEVDHCVTVRNRDSMQQERISIDKLAQYITDFLKD